MGAYNQMADKNLEDVINNLLSKPSLTKTEQGQLQQMMVSRATRGLSPTEAELKYWGINRDQYRSMWTEAEKEWKGDTGFLGKLFAGNNVNEVNQYLYNKMISSGGSFKEQAIAPTNINRNINPNIIEVTAPTGSSSSSSVSKSTGGGYSTPVEPIKNYTADELAQRFGIVNDYATILKEMQDATTAKFDETETTMKRAEASNLRSQESAYNQYLQDLRSRSANAVASGATKGTMAANALTSLLGFQESNRESTNLMNDLLYDTAQQRGTTLKEDAIEARKRETEIGQYLGTLSTSMDTNAINKYAAELAKEAQIRSAGITAGGQVSAARASANSAYEQILNAFKNDYRNKGYNSNQANALAYTKYVDYLDRQYPTK